MLTSGHFKELQVVANDAFFVCGSVLQGLTWLSNVGLLFVYMYLPSASLTAPPANFPAVFFGGFTGNSGANALGGGGG
jgi:hypothetical protein